MKHRIEVNESGVVMKEVRSQKTEVRS